MMALRRTIAWILMILALVLAYAVLAAGSLKADGCRAHAGMICFELTADAQLAVSTISDVGGAANFASEAVEHLQAELDADYRVFIPLYCVLYIAIATWLGTTPSVEASALSIGIALLLMPMVNSDLEENRALQEAINVLRVYTVTAFWGLPALPDNGVFEVLAAAGRMKWFACGVLSSATGAAFLAVRSEGQWLILPGMLSLASAVCTFYGLSVGRETALQVSAISSGFMLGLAVPIAFGFCHLCCHMPWQDLVKCWQRFGRWWAAVDIDDILYKYKRAPVAEEDSWWCRKGLWGWSIDQINNVAAGIYTVVAVLPLVILVLQGETNIRAWPWPARIGALAYFAVVALSPNLWIWIENSAFFEWSHKQFIGRETELKVEQERFKLHLDHAKAMWLSIIALYGASFVKL